MPTADFNAERWRQGLTLEAYLDQMGKFQAVMRRRLQILRLFPEDRAFFGRLTGPLRILVLTENTCGDSLMNLPILARAAAAAPDMAVRIFVRSQNPDLAEAFARRGIHNIPIFLFMDGTFEEIGLWVERPQPANSLLEEWWAQHPRAAALRAKEVRPRAEALALKKASEARLAAMEAWYDAGLQQATVAELKRLLQPRLEAQGA